MWLVQIVLENKRRPPFTLNVYASVVVIKRFVCILV